MVSPMRSALPALFLLAACESSKPASTPPPVVPSPTSGSGSAAVAPAAGASVEPADMSALAASSNTFGFDLYARLRTTPGNLAISPASITTALAMTWGGARGETAAQMAKVLHFAGTPAQVMTASGALAGTLTAPGRDVTFRIANQLFGETTYTFEPRFLEQTKAAFGAPLERLAFKADHEAARAKINGWVADRTEQRIKDLIPAAGLTPDTRLVLVNAIYFLGDWNEPFAMERTRPRPFFTTKEASKDVPTMHATDRFRYAQRDGASVIELPYKGKAMAMVLVVPDAVDGLPAVEGAIDAAWLSDAIGAMTYARVALALPRFEVAPAESVRLAEQLKAMGMDVAFDRERADFTGIANPPTKEDRLYIAEVFHKAFVKADEKGTEAAAATAVTMSRGGGVPAKPIELAADRPFLFFIRDTATGLVVFMGRVADPAAKG